MYFILIFSAYFCMVKMLFVSPRACRRMALSEGMFVFLYFS